MNKRFDLISMGEAVVEIFRKNIDVSLYEVGDFTGPYPSGAPAITADTMAKLGGKTAFIATVGNDEFGTTLIKRLTGDGVDTSQILKLDNAMTGIAFTSYKSSGERNFIYNFTTAATAYLDPEYIYNDFIASGKWLHISGNVLAFSETTHQAVVKAVEAAYEAGVPISLDPNIRSEIMDKKNVRELFQPVLEKTSVMIPSIGELNWIFGNEKKEEQIISELLQANIDLIVRKEGDHGSTFFTREGKTHANSFNIDEIVDPTGCGDAFCAGVIYGLLRGWPHDKTAVFANAVGGITATKKGAMEGINNINEVKDFLYKNNFNKYFGDHT